MEEKDFKHDETVKQEKQVQLLAKGLMLKWLLVGNMVVLGLIIVVISIVIHSYNDDNDNNDNNVIRNILTQVITKKPQDLESFLNEQPYAYLGGKEWINNYIRNTSGELEFWRAEPLVFNKGYIGALVEDFDGDGEDELLLITVNSPMDYNSFNYNLNEISYIMYEWVNEQWTKTSVWQTNFSTLSLDYCKIDMFSKTYDGKIYLFFNSYVSRQFIAVDGHECTFKGIVYSDNNFVQEISFEGGHEHSIQEYSKFGFTLGTENGDIFDNDTSIQKIARIQMNSLLEETNGFAFMSSLNSPLTEFPAINVQILDFANGNGKVAENFETYFQKNPIDLAIELERGIALDTERNLLNNYIMVWKNEIFHAYESLIALSRDDEKEQVQTEYNTFQENIDTFLHEVEEQSLIEADDITVNSSSNAGIYHMRMGAYNAFREHAKELYERVYAKNTLYTYSFSPAQRHTQLQALLLASLQGQLQGELLEPLEPQTTESSSFLPLYNGDYIFPDSNRRFLSEEEVAEVDLHSLYIARNEIYARYGRLFHDSRLQDYFDSMDWYHGTILPEDFDPSLLNVYEVSNIHLFQQFEEEID